jgi:light-regulated signal transduction histidine kinase (bacteriophytochrome)
MGSPPPSPSFGPHPHPADPVDPCAAEPIHVPQAIQAGGGLLVLDPEDGRVLEAAGLRALGLLAPRDVLRRRVEEVLPALPDLERQQLKASLQAGRVFRHRIGGGSASPGAEDLPRIDLVAHRNPQGRWLLELEPGSTPAAELAVRRRLDQALLALEACPRSLRAVLQTAVEGFREILGCDRVIVYRFHPAWDGEVVAEARSGDLDPTLGLRFPASDIPPQARALAGGTAVRVLVDAEAAPDPLLAPPEHPTGEPTDLGAVVHRAQSPVHRRYLAALGVRASSSFSLNLRGRLWGLVIAHHRRPLRPSATARFAGELLARWLSREIEVAEERDRVARSRAVDGCLQALARRAEDAARSPEESDYWDALLRGPGDLGSLVVCDGGAVVLAEGRRLGWGRRPGDEALDALVRHFEPRLAPQEVWSTDRLLEEVPALRGRPVPADPAFGDEDGAVCCGVLAARLSPVRSDFVFWFREEAIRTITWAGDPSKPYRPGSSPGPRSSFAAWRETVRGRSWPWEDWERAAAAAFLGVLTDVDRRSGAELRLQADLLQRVEQEVARRAPGARCWGGVDEDAAISVARLAAHDLKEPLRGMRGYARLLLEDHGDRLDDDGRHMLGALERLSGRLEQLVDDLGTLARSVREPLVVDGPVPVDAALASVVELLAPRLEVDGARVRVEGRLPSLPCDRVALEHILANLVVNAIKYTDGPDREVTVGVEPGTDPPVLFVRDHGIGIAAPDRERIFEPFRRLHPREARGGGSGLGLAIVSRLVERHGGRIWVAPTPGGGATFRFTLAAAGERPAHGAPEEGGR